jgi:hypothetical protein
MIQNKIQTIYNTIIELITKGQLRVEIETPQFLTTQEKFYMLRQRGWISVSTLTFKYDRNEISGHDVYFWSIKDVYSSVVKIGW